MASRRFARALNPHPDIRIENFHETRLSEGRIDAVIGNASLVEVMLEYDGIKRSLRDFFFAKSIGALKTGNIHALVTSRFAIDQQRDHRA
jgi:hypothetical protein